MPENVIQLFMICFHGLFGLGPAATARGETAQGDNDEATTIGESKQNINVKNKTQN